MDSFLQMSLTIQEDNWWLLCSVQATDLSVRVYLNNALNLYSLRCSDERDEEEFFSILKYESFFDGAVKSPLAVLNSFEYAARNHMLEFDREESILRIQCDFLDSEECVVPMASFK